MKFTKSALSAAIPFLLLASCTRKPVMPLFETLAIDTLLGSEKSSCRVEYRFATITNTDRSPALRDIEASNIAYFFELEEFTGTAQDAAAQAIRELAGELTLPGGLEGEVSIESEATVLDTLLTYTITRSSFTGGAHGIYGMENHTYSIPGGYELTLAEIVPDQSRQQLDSLIRIKLYAQYQVSDDDGLSAKGFFPESITATENFQLAADGITFFYNPYEIGCYALGNVEVGITREELDKF